ncbi:nicotinate phosphoribosyltransferase [Methylohalomonas lacus]|uniref:Nicotinate phosphoribosyltransferase n=1 Tax=Methylohalomonas lacus TaxID=398773 RepID=A0AAE3L0Y4_9GAMM|nr:nicotinate phosphoribosyltransferase [Methylohalomonas lacus]MCS3902815.1 nicotinate phosphoribosyltransferase [Methylohalomonas lacus]
MKEHRAAGLEQVNPLLTDLYQLTMLQAYYSSGMEETAVFEFFVRKLPAGRRFLLAAGLEQLLAYLQELQFTETELQWLRDSGRFSDACLERLADWRFSGDVAAMPEGSVFFANEPILRVTAPLPEAQLIEPIAINLLHFQTLIASKAARFRLAAPDGLLVDFGLRRAHTPDAGLLAARAAVIGGFDGTATVAAGAAFDAALYGTMAHSYIQAWGDEYAAFAHFARVHPDNAVLLIDTYDTLAATDKVVRLAHELQQEGIAIRAVRIDSGDLDNLSRQVRAKLDAGGCQAIRVLVSGGLDEHEIAGYVAAGAPIDGYGVGTQLDCSADHPYLDCAYKLQEYAGRPCRKRSTGKATWPGRKQVYRNLTDSGLFDDDVLALESESQAGKALLQPVMRQGQRLHDSETTEAIQQRVGDGLARLPASLRHLQADTDASGYEVRISEELRALAESVDREAD